MKRQKMRLKKDRAIFRRTAQSVNTVNISNQKVARGGTRL